ncbi:two-component system sensor histidine kinase CiaH [Streptococcus moroccensis]|uniref:histidine kinase n=2 Tax=Streptococcus moroccensis TaxID=1451356 RepID=A0ABT9YT48_9STRE|nr:two-component system sensor histidine kinase CiaH [Streptococcus moroccensis]
MWTKVKSIFKSDIFKYFLRYFSVFTVIFLAMTVIILQLITNSLYQNTDKTLDYQIENPGNILYIAQVRSLINEEGKITAVEEIIEDENQVTTGENSDDNEVSEAPRIKKLDIKIGTSSQAILFDEDKNPVTRLDHVLGLDKINPNFSNLGVIQELEITTSFDTIDTYRYVIVELDDSYLQDSSVKYAMSLINVTQLKSTGDATRRIVLYVMIGFWLASTFAALMLTVITVKPIRDSLEKQKAFVENASHELRTPLAVLQNRLESLFRKPDATILEESESIASSLEEVRNMRLLTTNLLNLARRDGQLKVVMETVEPGFFESMFENFSLIAEENEKQFKSQNLVRKTIKADSALLKQLITILFDNAVKYTGEDGEIRITSKVRERLLVITVEDNGVGISDENKKKVFDRFYRVDKARTRQNGGFGLGLSLAKQIVDQLKGQILVHDRVPNGTIFEIRLPL